MEKDELTAILAALLIGSGRNLTPAEATDLAEDIQRTITAHNRAAELARREASITNLDAARASTRDLLRALNPDT